MVSGHRPNISQNTRQCRDRTGQPRQVGLDKGGLIGNLDRTERTGQPGHGNVWKTYIFAKILDFWLNVRDIVSKKELSLPFSLKCLEYQYFRENFRFHENPKIHFRFNSDEEVYQCPISCAGASTDFKIYKQMQLLHLDSENFHFSQVAFGFVIHKCV
jgi:hypothetical protein